MTLARTFLVVDDSKLHHQMYQIILSRPALSVGAVLHAYDGREGYALFTAHPEIAIVFLDLNMPVMNGLEFLERRRAEGLHPQVPIVLVTTESTPEDEARGLAAGAWAYLRKPFTPEQLEAVVERAFGRTASASSRS
jgi:two-component system chemotaxis response regulator CheY